MRLKNGGKEISRDIEDCAQENLDDYRHIAEDSNFSPAQRLR